MISMLMGVAMVGMTVMGRASRWVGHSPFLHSMASTKQVTRLLRRNREIHFTTDSEAASPLLVLQ